MSLTATIRAQRQEITRLQALDAQQQAVIREQEHTIQQQRTELMALRSLVTAKRRTRSLRLAKAGAKRG